MHRLQYTFNRLRLSYFSDFLKVQICFGLVVGLLINDTIALCILIFRCNNELSLQCTFFFFPSPFLLVSWQAGYLLMSTYLILEKMHMLGFCRQRQRRGKLRCRRLIGRRRLSKQNVRWLQWQGKENGLKGWWNCSGSRKRRKRPWLEISPAHKVFQRYAAFETSAVVYISLLIVFPS